ncbi:MAG: aspartate aminotransferase family protein [Candidatus Micrarchaeota archaeon]
MYNLPGVKSKEVLEKLKRLNGDVTAPFPMVLSGKGEGCYFEDLDGNKFLDFGCQVATVPLGYNHPGLKEIIKEYIGRSPLKYAIPDFPVKEHLDLLEELLEITPKELNAAFFVNSGAEAVENAMKIILMNRCSAKCGISFEGAFHGRTLGALSASNSNIVHKKNLFTVSMRRLPFSVDAIEKLERILAQDVSADEIGFIIIEAIQGEGGYRVAPKELIQSLRKFTKEHGIPLILDEVQAGMGRTGKWWAYQNFGITPDVMTCAKALQVGATVSRKEAFPQEEGAISSTWGGGQIVDLITGRAILQTIKKDHLLANITKQGEYLRQRLSELGLENVRGFGLMNGFDLPSGKVRGEVLKNLMKRGVILLPAGSKSVRVIPPYIVSEKETDEAMEKLKICLDLSK